jgi:hypothetical protein
MGALPHNPIWATSANVIFSTTMAACELGQHPLYQLFSFQGFF